METRSNQNNRNGRNKSGSARPNYSKSVKEGFDDRLHTGDNGNGGYRPHGVNNGYGKRRGGAGSTPAKDRYKAPFDAKETERKPSLREEPIHSAEETGFSSVGNGAVIGRNAVRELLRSGRPVDKLLVISGEHKGPLVPIVGEALERGIPVVETEKRKLDELAGFAPHQGVIAMAAEKEYCDVDDILAVARERGEKPLIVIADGICDPYNLGAIIRCAEGCGAHGLILAKRHAAGLTPLVTKSSAGAIEHLAIAKVPNIAAAIEALKKEGIWIFAAEADGESFYDVDMNCPAAIVLGSEGEGVSALVRKRSDFTVSIPMYGKVNSFNVSTAASVLLCEAAHQQRKK